MTPSIKQLLADLDQARFAAKSGESVLEELGTPPWESNAPAVIAAWKALTDPANLEALEAMWSRRDDWNPTARATFEVALQECRERCGPDG